MTSCPASQLIWDSVECRIFHVWLMWDPKMFIVVMFNPNARILCFITMSCYRQAWLALWQQMDQVRLWLFGNVLKWFFYFLAQQYMALRSRQRWEKSISNPILFNQMHQKLVSHWFDLLYVILKLYFCTDFGRLSQDVLRPRTKTGRVLFRKRSLRSFTLL